MTCPTLTTVLWLTLWAVASARSAAQSTPLAIDDLQVLRVVALAGVAPRAEVKPVIVLLDAGDGAEATRLDAEGYAILTVAADDVAMAQLAALQADVLRIRRAVAAEAERLRLDPDRVFFLRAGFRLATDTTFFRARGYDYDMDVRFPAPATTASPVPVVLQIAHKTGCRRCHGSFARYGDGLLDALALLGYATAHADHYGAGFRDYDKVDWMPQAVHPAKAAVQFLRANARAFGLDTARVLALGFSKGGTAAAMLAVTGDVPEFELGDPAASPSSRVTAALSIGAYLDLPTLYADADGDIDERWENPLAQWGPPELRPNHWRAGSATSYVSAGDAPLMLVAGGADSYRPRQQARMAALLDSAGVAHETLVVPGLGHALPAEAEHLEAVAAFIERWVGRP